MTNAAEYFRPVASIILKRLPMAPNVQGDDNDLHSIHRNSHSTVYLLVKKPRKDHAWQFPQGGIDPGETLTEAALRELAEECGTDLKAQLLDQEAAGVYQYRFPSKFIEKKKKWRGIGAKGAECALSQVEFVRASWVSGQCQPDQKEIIDFAWVTRDELKDYVAPEYGEIIKTQKWWPNLLRCFKALLRMHSPASYGRFQMLKFYTKAQYSAKVMGNDGGSIPRRIELVKEKQRDVKLNPDLERIAAWFHCALSKAHMSMDQQPLEQPIVACGLGKLYNQDAVIEYLLDKSAYGDGDRICSHISSIKDTVKLTLTPNPAYNDSDATTMGHLDKDIKSRFICPISMKEMNGKHRFVYLDTCGCVFAEQALKEIPSKECVSCGKSFEANNNILINPAKEELESMKVILEEKKAKIKAEKKAKKAAKSSERKSGEKRKREVESPEKVNNKKPNLSSSAATVVMSKVAQELAEKQKKQVSAAVKSIYAKKDIKGNYLTMGTFNRYA
ncbi:hypothetical protein DFQ29_006748 [Apophysomyces sp. BC1021]|nr:hypothetical protein DFQ29_006748 [Apophysomyces sp. BC1021]